MFALLTLIYLVSETVVYYGRVRDSTGESKKVLPAVSFITNDLEIKDRSKDINIFEFEEESKEKKKGILSEWSDERTEVIEADAQSKEPEEIIRHYDLTPSTQTQYSMKNSNHISPIHLPMFSLLFAIPFTILPNISSSTIRSTIFLVISILHLVCVIIFSNSSLKSLRNIKMIVFSCTYIILSGIGVATSMNPQTIDLIKIDIVIVTFVTVGLLFNIATLIASVLKSEAYREYLINRKN